MSKKSFKPGTMLNPVPVVMLSVGDKEKKNIITVAWTGIINSEPPMCYASVRRERFSHDIIEEKNEFVINLVSKDLARACDFCGVKSGKDIDKFEVCKLHAGKAEKIETPTIEESPVSIECKVVNKLELGSHDMFLAEIVNVGVDEKYIDKNGKIHFDWMNLVAYSHGSYVPLAKESLGGFGFSVMKPKTIAKKRGERRDYYRSKAKNSGK